MSLFRKPKKRMQMRAFATDDDDHDDGSGRMDTDENIPQPPPAPSIRPVKVKSKDKTKPKQTLLSFGDEVEEETDMFQVRKSSHSKKLMRRKDRERRNDDVKSNGNGVPPPPPLLSTTTTVKTSQDEAITNNSRKNDSYSEPKKSLEGAILTGRAAVSALRSGDVSGSDDGEDPEQDDDVLPSAGAERFRHAYVRHSGKSVRAILDSGGIPDAAVIHAARKKRQQVREGADFIPVQSSTESSLVTDRLPPRPGGRLVREDGEGDGEDEDPDRIDNRQYIPFDC